MPTKVILYGCRAPHESADLIADQISKAHKYYNQMVELHRKKLDDVNSARKDLFPEYADLEKAKADADRVVDGLVDAIRAENAKARRKRATPEESAALVDAKAKRKDLAEQLKAMREAIKTDATYQARLAAINVKYNGTLEDGKTRRRGGLLKDARKHCGVYPGTYLRVEAAIEAAIKDSTGPLQFRAWKGDGSIGVQIQGGCTWQEMVVGKGRVANLLKAEPLPTNRTSAKTARPWLFSVRVMSDESGRPVWTRLCVWVHPGLMPDDARIMSVALLRRRLPSHRMNDGTFHERYDWSLQFTVRYGEEKPRAITGACGIDLGWRLIEGNMRVAYLVGDDGHREELILPVKLLRRWSKSQSLAGIRDLNFDAVKASVIAWKQGLPEIPEWLAEAAKLVGQWRAKGKLVHLMGQWAANRIAGDEEIFATLQAWREQDAHLWQWQVANDVKAQRTRLHLYRNFAHRVSQRYGKIVVEDCDWRKVQRKKKADDNQSDNGARTYMRIASVGKIRELLKQVGGVMVDSSNTTRTCHACGSLEEWDQAKDLVHTCESCSLPWDQDYNAAMNLLASAPVPTETPDPLAEQKGETADGDSSTAVQYVGRWAKRKSTRSKSLAETSSTD